MPPSHGEGVERILRSHRSGGGGLLPRGQEREDGLHESLIRNHVPDLSNEPMLQQEVLLAQGPLHVADPVLDPALKTDVITLREITAIAKSNYFRKIGH